MVSSRLFRGLSVFCATTFALCATSPSLAAPPAERVPDEVIVTWRPGASPGSRGQALARHGHHEAGSIRFRASPSARVNRMVKVKVPPGRDLDEVIAELRADPDVESAHPNYVHRVSAVQDNEFFPLQWALENTGSNATFDGIPGIQFGDRRVADADIDAVEAFDQIAAEGLPLEPLIVAIIDSGIDYLHEDLAPIIWTNPGEIPGNGVDDDDNGFVDDVNGFDFDGQDPDPMDGNSHGTHCAGVVAAVQTNALGMCGIAGHVQLMALKGLSDGGSGSSFALAQAVVYAADNGAALSNNSWGGQIFDPTIEAAVEDARATGHLFVAAAGNSNLNMDVVPFGPAGFELDNVISVLATTAWRDRAVFSNFGAHGADLGAPGHEILSTTPGISPGEPNFDYQIAFGGFPWSGTSMASPQVAGAAAVVFGLGPVLFPGWEDLDARERVQAVRNHILARVEPWPSLQGLTVTGGHLNLAHLLSRDTTPPDAIVDLAISERATSSVTLVATATGDDGLNGQASRWEVRYARGDAASFDFATATSAHDLWTPASPGEEDFIHVEGLLPGTTYSFAVAMVDEAGNVSAPSAPVTTTTQAGLRLFFDDGERGTNGWTASGGWTLSTEIASSPTRAWNDSPNRAYSNNANATLTSRRIGGTTNRPLVLRWVQRTSFNVLDTGLVRVQTFSGNTPGASFEVALESNSRGELHERVARLGVLPGDSVQVSFVLRSDAQGTADGWIIDDVELVAETTPTETVVNDSFTNAANWTLTAPWAAVSGRLDSSNIQQGIRASAMLAAPLDFTDVRGALARFDIPAASFAGSPNLGSYFHFEYSLDGTTWKTLLIEQQVQTGARVVDLGIAAGHPSVFLRFRVDSGLQGGGSGIDIDNFRVLVRRATFTAPTVTITAPADGARIPATGSTAGLSLTGTATDPEDGSLTSRIEWSVDGAPAGTGTNVPVTLALGAHTIEATVTDFDGTTTTATVSVEVGDECPDDPDKTEPGVCGCGVPDIDTDADLTLDCNETCDEDPLKLEPGACGCGEADTDTDTDGAADCIDECADDPAKIDEGVCGCGTPDDDSDLDLVADCIDGCADDPDKSEEGICGCGVPDDDTDNDGTADCLDLCFDDAGKTGPGVCGCGVSDVDSDLDGVADCHDACDDDADKTEAGVCGCGVADNDRDGDGTLDCEDECPVNYGKTAPGVCGCGTPDTDTDGDGTPDCNDGCVDDPNKTLPLTCGCGSPDTDSDDDGTLDCDDACDDDPNKTELGACGCGVSDEDADEDGQPDCFPGIPDDEPAPKPPEPESCSTSGTPADAAVLAFPLLALIARRRRSR